MGSHRSCTLLQRLCEDELSSTCVPCRERTPAAGNGFAVQLGNVTMWWRGLKATLPRAVSVRHANGEQDAQRRASPHAEVSTSQGQHPGEGEAREQPAWLQVAVLLFCWGVFVMFTLLLSHYPRCSSRYWAIFGVQGAACLAAEGLFIHLVSTPQALLLASSYVCCPSSARHLMPCRCVANPVAAM